MHTIVTTFWYKGKNENVEHNHTWCVWRIACNLLRALRWHVKFALHHLDSETTSSKRRRHVCTCMLVYISTNPNVHVHTPSHTLVRASATHSYLVNLNLFALLFATRNDILVVL